MDISYNFEIASVSLEASCMEVVYSANGYSTHRISTRLPYSDESIEAVVESYAPIMAWANEGKTFATVTVGASGSLQYSTPTPPEVMPEINPV